MTREAVVEQASFGALLKAASPDVAFGVRMAASVSLALFAAFWLELDNAFWAAASAAVVCQPNLGASLRKAWFRLIGTLVGAAMIVAISALFTQDRLGFLAALALWGAACALLTTLLRNFASYGAALAGYTAVIVARDTLGASGGGPDGHVFILALWRASEICTGIVCAAVVFALTDFGAARTRLADMVGSLIERIGSQFVRTLTTLKDSRLIRREFIRDVIALDPAIDQAIGESSELRYDSQQLAQTASGMFSALAAWRAVDTHLYRASADSCTKQDLQSVLQALPPDASVSGWPTQDPVALRDRCLRAIRRLLSQPAVNASRQLLIDQTARALFGLREALAGLALLVGDPNRRPSRSTRQRPHVGDWAPPLLNAVRALLAIGAASIVWIMTSWSEGALCITWAAITVILFGPRGENADASVLSFLAGTCLAAVLAAIANFVVLPQMHSFTGLAIVLSCYLIPVGALSAHFPQNSLLMAMAANFVPLVAPANLASYDTLQFYNSALALCAGCAIGVLSFKLLPPLSPAARAQRLLRSTLRDLRAMAGGPLPPRPDAWQGLLYTRLADLPDSAEPLQRARIVAALSAGTEMIRLGRLINRLSLSGSLSPALMQVVQGHSVRASMELADLDTTLSARAGTRGIGRLSAHARGSALALSEVLTQHSIYFDARLHEAL
jgi:uncharacterized membrane protein YccC